ncbi:MAG: ATP-binding protein [Candidatus Eisenbacteria bacterium]|nr:ATP-binding protein [Candidatus Eisenbacteria bacterium]
MPERRLQLDIPVSARWLHVAANFIRAAAEGAGFDEDAMEAIEIASMEAVENVIDHSKLGSGDRLQLESTFDGRDFVVQIRDRGIPWPHEVTSGMVGHDMPPPDAPRGRGIAMMRALMDEVTPWQGTDGEKVLRMVKHRANVDAAGSSAHA